MAHDFKRFPELTNNQMNLYYFDSPHQQIAEDFDARVANVHDGDTITLEVSWRDFTFPLRMSNLLAPELNEEGGVRSRDKLKELIENATVEIIIDKTNRVGKYGRLLGKVRHKGFDVGTQMIEEGFAVSLDEEQPGIKDLVIRDLI
jgi:endonuclease YncB( thermonuclease family)